MNQKLFEFIENSDEIEILENTYESEYLVLKTEYVYELLFNILESEFISDENILLEIGYYKLNVIEFIKLNKSEYIIIIKL